MPWLILRRVRQRPISLLSHRDDERGGKRNLADSEVSGSEEPSRGARPDSCADRGDGGTSSDLPPMFPLAPARTPDRGRNFWRISESANLGTIIPGHRPEYIAPRSLVANDERGTRTTDASTDCRDTALQLASVDAAFTRTTPGPVGVGTTRTFGLSYSTAFKSSSSQIFACSLASP